MKRFVVSCVVAGVSFIGLSQATSQLHVPEERRISRPQAQEPCFDASDPSQHTLWPNGAPGASGNDPCRDIPFIQVFPAEGEARSASPAILIIPGGGYDHLTDTKEQIPVAEYFSQQLHVTAILVRYRLVQPDGQYAYPVPMWDGQRAIRMVRAMAPQFGVDPRRIGVFGFSAGGHLATTLALHPEETFGRTTGDRIDAVSATVDLLGLGYPVISMDREAVPPSGSYRNLLKQVPDRERRQLENFLSGEKHVTEHMPPVFLFESMDDARISPNNSLLFANALRAHGVPADVHIFQHGEHGSGLSEGIPEEQTWPEDFGRWLKRWNF